MRWEQLKSLNSEETISIIEDHSYELVKLNDQILLCSTHMDGSIAIVGYNIGKERFFDE